MGSHIRFSVYIGARADLLPTKSCTAVSNQKGALRGLAHTWRRAGFKTTISIVRHNQHWSAGAIGPSAHAFEPAFDLPVICPGCGAYTQRRDCHDPGFYSRTRNAVRAFVGQAGTSDVVVQSEDDLVEEVLRSVDSSLKASLEVGADGRYRSALPSHRTVDSKASRTVAMPICDRCHRLKHNQDGKTLIHPDIQSIRDIISESSYKYNHIYHVLDAADFPLSLIPSLYKSLSLTLPRSLNRRAKTRHYQHGKTADLSYVITRSDLLAPKKEQVDRLMPYIVRVLRDALGNSGHNVRLGNVYCVSSLRGWWTNTLKEDIWKRGGAGWLVGKVNVGKSSLVECVFPKGRTGKTGPIVPLAGVPNKHSIDRQVQLGHIDQGQGQSSYSSLLPPTAGESAYPVMPLVSSLPGTTASPIRLPFGNSNGELIDLPGLRRGDLESHLSEQSRKDIVMRQRVKPCQMTIMPGQSLVVGDLIRITPTSPDIVMLAYPFVPLRSHIVSAGKRITADDHRISSKRTRVVRSNTDDRLLAAGTFPLRWDVTKDRAGPLTRKAAADLSTKTLPFLVLSTDVLIEGCGWIELVAQVRKKDFESAGKSSDMFDAKPYPMVEIMSPAGKCVGVRRPMGAWLLAGDLLRSARKDASRPRRSMKGVKKHLKQASSRFP